MPGQAGAQRAVSSCCEQIRAVRTVKKSSSRGALYVFPPSATCWSCGRIPLGWPGESSAPVWIGICRGTSSPRRWHHRSEQTPTIHHLFFRFISWGWSHGKGKTQLALQGMAPCQGLDGECDKVCLFLQVWLQEPRAGLCYACCTGQQQSGCRRQHAWASTCVGSGTSKSVPWFHGLAGGKLAWLVFAQSMSLFPNLVQ